MPDEKKPANKFKRPSPGKMSGKSKVVVYGEEMVEAGVTTVSMTD